MFSAADLCRRDPRQLWLLDFLAERKAHGDLVSSIKDGRYRKQKVGMFNSGLRNLLYIVEGSAQSLTSESISMFLSSARFRGVGMTDPRSNPNETHGADRACRCTLQC